MTVSLRRLGPVVVAGVLWGILPAPAVGQNAINGNAPGLNGFNPYAQFSSLTPEPYWGYSGYPRSISPEADLVRAQGQILLDVQQAYLMREQVKVAKLETRRK